MEIKSTVGICTKLDDNDDKLVVIPKDGEMFKENQVVILLSATEFENFSEEVKSFINMIKSAQDITKG